MLAKEALPFPSPLLLAHALQRFLGRLQWLEGEKAALPSQKQSSGNGH